MIEIKYQKKPKNQDGLTGEEVTENQEKNAYQEAMDQAPPPGLSGDPGQEPGAAADG